MLEPHLKPHLDECPLVVSQQPSRHSHRLPHREKNGWTGDAHLAAEQAMFNYFAPAFYTKWINDLGDEQQPDGKLPGIVPSSGWGYAWGNGPAWDNAFLLIPYYQYLYYGDTEMFRATTMV